MKIPPNIQASLVNQSLDFIYIFIYLALNLQSLNRSDSFKSSVCQVRIQFSINRKKLRFMLMKQNLYIIKKILFSVQFFVINHIYLFQLLFCYSFMFQFFYFQDNLQLYYNKQQMINLDKFDPDWKFAQQHGKANVAGIPPTDNVAVCPCCHVHINKTPVGLWENSKQLQFLGFGFPLFYQFLKNCIILLILAICSYNAFSIHQAISNNYQLCHNTASTHRLLASTQPAIQPAAQHTTTQTNVTKVSTHGSCYTFMIQVARIQDVVAPNQEAIRIVSFVLHLLALVYIRNRITKLEAYYDERTTSLSDYSLFFKGLPKIKSIQKNLRQFLNSQFQRPHEIKQITLLPEYQQIQTLEEQKHQIIERLRKYYKKQTLNEKEQTQSKFEEERLQLVQKKLHSQALKTKNLAKEDELTCQKIICVLGSQQQKSEVISQFSSINIEKKRKYFGEHADRVYVKQAPDPQTIVWVNANIPKKKRILLILLGWVLSLLTLVITFIIFFFIIEKKSLILEEATLQLQKHPDQQTAKTSYRGALALVFIMMFLVVIFDKVVLATLFYKFTYLEKHSTTSKFQFSFALKLALGLFFTTALMTLAVQAIRFHNYYLHAYGVIDQETIMFFMNSFFVPFFWLVNPFRIFKIIKRKIFYKNRNLTQREANMLMEEEHYDMGKRFAQVIQMMWFTFLYGTLIPIGAVITCIGLIFYYWVDKYNLLRRSSIQGNISGKLILKSVTLLDFTLILRPAGSLIFDSQIRTFYMTSNIIMVVIAFVFLIIPKNKLIQLVNQQKFRPENKQYEEVKQTFHKTYHTQHPILRMIEFERLVQNIIKKGISLGSGGVLNSIKSNQNILSNHAIKNYNDMIL